MKALLWTSKSLRKLAIELKKKGHEISPTLVGNLLHEMDYSLQANSKTIEGDEHIDRDDQFQYINNQAKMFLAAKQPVISVDTKKKELIGNFKNNGKEWHRKGSPDKVQVHDFIDPKLKRAVPYSVYDIVVGADPVVGHRVQRRRPRGLISIPVHLQREPSASSRFVVFHIF